MKLQQWLKEKGISQTEFAKRIGVDPSLISHVVRGKKPASGWLIQRIHDETEGEVSVKDWPLRKRQGLSHIEELNGA